MFCPQCGKPVDNAAKFCPYCGQPMPQEKASPDEPSASTSLDSEVCRVTIRRINQFYVYNPKMKVFLDGVEVCAVKNASTVTFEAAKGTHTLRITSFFRKKQVQISILEDTELVVGWNRLTGGINVKTSAPISARSFFSKGQESPSTQSNTTNHMPRGIVIGGAIAITVIIVVVLVMIFGVGTASEISTVQNGYLGEYTDMTVKEVLDSYYGLIYQAEGEWISGENADAEGVIMVQVEYSSELLGTTTLQFTLLDEQCFEITYIDDPMETIEEASDVLAVLNKVYVAAYESQYEQAELAEIEVQLLERLTEVNATSVRYGASADYEGDRSQLYQLFGDTQLDMSATDLLELYGIVDYTGRSNQGTANTDFSWLLGEYETTSPGSGGEYMLSLYLSEDTSKETAFLDQYIDFSLYYYGWGWDSDTGEFYDWYESGYSGTLYFISDENNQLLFSGTCVDATDMETHSVTMTYDGEYFHVSISSIGWYYEDTFFGP